MNYQDYINQYRARLGGGQPQPPVLPPDNRYQQWLARFQSQPPGPQNPGNPSMNSWRQKYDEYLARKNGGGGAGGGGGGTTPPPPTTPPTPQQMYGPNPSQVVGSPSQWTVTLPTQPWMYNPAGGYQP